MLDRGDSFFGTARTPVGEILKHLRRIGKVPAACDLSDCPSRFADSDTHAVAYRNGKRRQEWWRPGRSSLFLKRLGKLVAKLSAEGFGKELGRERGLQLGKDLGTEPGSLLGKESDKEL